MNRDVNTTIDQYSKLKVSSRSADLYASDIYALWDISTINNQLDIYRLTGKSFEFGFVIGYKAALKLLKKKTGSSTRNKAQAG